MALSRWLLPILAVVSVAACRSRETVAESAPPGPSASAAAPAASVPISPVPQKDIETTRNPNGDPPYSGPTGTIRGTIHVSGDAPPEDPEIGRVPRRCEDARAFYGKLFREGPNRELADVLVAVTEYQGYLPPAGDVKNVTIRGCAYESRTLAMVFGQRLDVWNKGGEPFMPTLVGSKQAALVVAVPGGDPVRLFPTRVGQYTLTDQSHEYAQADLFVLKFPTFAVTGLDGKFEIRGIPVGEVQLSAQLPATRGTAQQRVKVVSGEATVVDLTIPFSLKPAAPAPSGAAVKP